MLVFMSKGSKSSQISSVRIIGGQWRGRKIEFVPDGIRPTGDRVRETLFNWLAGRLEGMRCLDLFAGSGALGFEALSRGAASVLLVEQNSTAISHLRANRDQLNAPVEILCADAWSLPFKGGEAFDIVFADPPFDSAETANLCKLLATAGCLAADALIYIEVGRSAALPELPPGWRVLRERMAGQVRYALLCAGEQTDEQE